MSRVLVVGTGSRAYREYMLRQVAEAHEVLLVDSAPPTWQEPYISSFHQVDPSDGDALLDTARRLAPDGVMTWVELHVPSTAVLAERLGLPGIGADASYLCRDKALMRRRWWDQGVPSAVSSLVRTRAEAEAAAVATGYPVVVKPRALGASVGVVLAQDTEELRAAFRVADRAHLGTYESSGVLVEEYLPGPEVSVESVVRAGIPEAVAITRKRLGPPPYFEEVGHVVDAADELLGEPALTEAVRSAHRALGIRDGVTHAEVRLTPDGPRMVEIGARPGGDLIPFLVELASGSRLSPALAETALGKPWEPSFGVQRSSAVHFVYPDESGVIGELSFDPDLLPEGVEVVGQDWFGSVGDEVKLPPEGFITRVGVLVLTANDPSTLRESLEGISEVISVKIIP